MKFTDKIKSLREANELTQRQIASMLGIDVSIYNRYEKGERCMKRELINKMAAIYHIPVDELSKYWLAGQVYSLLYKEDNAKEVIGMVAEDIIEYGSKTIIKDINNE